jgi:hypothetical protein
MTSRVQITNRDLRNVPGDRRRWILLLRTRCQVRADKQVWAPDAYALQVSRNVEFTRGKGSRKNEAFKLSVTTII